MGLEVLECVGDDRSDGDSWEVAGCRWIGEEPGKEAMRTGTS